MLAPIVTAWRTRAQKTHRAKSFAKLLALKQQHRQGSTCELGAAHVIGVVCVSLNLANAKPMPKLLALKEQHRQGTSCMLEGGHVTDLGVCL